MFMKDLFHTFLMVVAVVIVVACRAAPVYPQPREEPLFPVADEGRTIYIDRTGKVALTVRKRTPAQDQWRVE
jgi:hypothetical protein